MNPLVEILLILLCILVSVDVAFGTIRSLATRTLVSTVNVIIEFIGHALAFALWRFTPAAILRYERGGIRVQIVKETGIRMYRELIWETTITVEARSLGLKYAIVNFMGLMIVKDIRKIEAETIRSITARRCSNGMWTLPLGASVQSGAYGITYTRADNLPGRWRWLAKLTAAVLGVPLKAQAKHVQSGNWRDNVAQVRDLYAGEQGYLGAIGVVVGLCIVMIIGFLYMLQRSSKNRKKEDLEFQITARERTRTVHGQEYGHCWVYLVTDRPIEREELREKYKDNSKVTLGWLKMLKKSRKYRSRKSEPAVWSNVGDLVHIVAKHNVEKDAWTELLKANLDDNVWIGALEPEVVTQVENTYETYRNGRAVGNGVLSQLEWINGVFSDANTAVRLQNQVRDLQQELHDKDQRLSALQNIKVTLNTDGWEAVQGEGMGTVDTSGAFPPAPPPV